MKARWDLRGQTMEGFGVFAGRCSRLNSFNSIVSRTVEVDRHKALVISIGWSLIIFWIRISDMIGDYWLMIVDQWPSQDTWAHPSGWHQLLISVHLENRREESLDEQQIRSPIIRLINSSPTNLGREQPFAESKFRDKIIERLFSFEGLGLTIFRGQLYPNLLLESGTFRKSITFSVKKF